MHLNGSSPPRLETLLFIYLKQFLFPLLWLSTHKIKFTTVTIGRVCFREGTSQ